MQNAPLIEIILPICLFIIMLGVGLSLVVEDFKRVLHYPKAVSFGLLIQIVCLPILAYSIVSGLHMSAELAVGLLILSFCPSGTTSNMITYLSKGDVALAISLTALTSLITPLTIPLLTQFTLTHFLSETQTVYLPVSKTLLQLALINILPVTLGMLLNYKFPHFCQKAEKPVKIFSALFLLAIIVGIIYSNWKDMPDFLAKTGLACLILATLSITLGFYFAQWIHLERKQAITIGIEVGIHNAGTGLFITGTLLHNTTMSIVPAMYGILMLLPALIFGVLVNLGPHEVDK